MGHLSRLPKDVIELVVSFGVVDLDGIHWSTIIPALNYMTTSIRPFFNFDHFTDPKCWTQELFTSAALCVLTTSRECILHVYGPADQWAMPELKQPVFESILNFEQLYIAVSAMDLFSGHSFFSLDNTFGMERSWKRLLPAFREAFGWLLHEMGPYLKCASNKYDTRRNTIRHAGHTLLVLLEALSNARKVFYAERLIAELYLDR